MAEVKQIALYGKGGIGKSTVACNLAVALAEMGEKVFQVGCSPKIDSTSSLRGGELPDYNILENTLDKGATKEAVKECIIPGYMGVLTAESGGPPPVQGCAGRGVSLALEYLAKYRLIQESGATFVIYDVVGDIVCGGFAQPMRAGYAREVYLVSSGELMSLYSSNNICRAIEEINKGKKATVLVGGIINNMRGVTKEEELVEEFGRMIQVPIVANIPRDSTVQEAESEGGTVMEKRPNSQQAERYRILARNIKSGNEPVAPKPVAIADILALLVKYQALD